VPRISKNRGPLETRLLAFFDAGNTAVRHKYSTDFKRTGISSAGVGIRMSLGNNFSFVGDYGWQLSDLPYQVEKTSRAHLKGTLAF
jgi:hemolysin activation/secretion protein